ncbi:MAG: hypothetical protein OEY73_06190 [Hadesarchaea archaeon]|nr:hypothetical protein [Hadesarchaea archaeon]
MIGAVVFYWGIPAVGGLLLAWAVMLTWTVPPELNWNVVSISVGVSLAFWAAYLWMRRRVKLKLQFVIGLILIFYGAWQLGWIPSV